MDPCRDEYRLSSWSSCPFNHIIRICDGQQIDPPVLHTPSNRFSLKEGKVARFNMVQVFLEIGVAVVVIDQCQRDDDSTTATESPPSPIYIRVRIAICEIVDIFFLVKCEQEGEHVASLMFGAPIVEHLSLWDALKLRTTRRFHQGCHALPVERT